MINKYTISATLIFFLAVGLLYREDISRVLSFDSGAGHVIVGVPPDDEPNDTLDPTEQDKDPVQNDTPRGNGFTVSPVTGDDLLDPRPAPPPYTGRDPEEVRPVEEEIKLFTQEQRETIFESIGTRGRSVNNDPRFFDGWIHLGLLKKNIGDFEGARDAWEYAGIIEPKNSLSFANLGELFWRYLPDLVESEKNFLISIENKPSDVLTHVSLAELYHYSFLEKYDSSTGVLLDGLEHSPNNETLMRRLAYLYEQRDEPEEALMWWQNVLVSSPDDEEVKKKIENLQPEIIVQ